MVVIFPLEEGFFMVLVGWVFVVVGLGFFWTVIIKFWGVGQVACDFLT